tara:strand:+ start:1220 stop:2908 length:1689 start_codon:yes stop_codon:yes gene_type:complete
MSILGKLTEGIVDRDLSKEGTALLNKWEQTGLLEGLGSDRDKNYMSRLLENQAKELLREASSMAGGDVEGFAAVAFPIVRRVFGGLIANDLVSVQPMSLPSGLIFFMDFTLGTDRGEQDDLKGTSVYGGGKVASEITGGVSLTGANADESFYNLNSGYSSPTGSVSVALGTSTTQLSAAVDNADLNVPQKAALRFDPDAIANTGAAYIQLTAALGATMNSVNLENLIDVACDGLGTDRMIRRLTTRDGNNLIITLIADNGTIAFTPGTSVNLSYPLKDAFTDSGIALGAVAGTDPWGLEGAGDAGSVYDGLARDEIPEIDIKVDSVAVTAVTKKLKAKWSPELGQDLNAYHNLDAEVELTSILSEQIALEIDQEILNDLVKGATASTYYWSRRPGNFVDRDSGLSVTADFTGTVSEWYETLLEVVNDVSAQIHRKVLRGGATFLVCSPEVANILEFTAGFRAKVTHDDDKGTAGTVNVGTLSGKWDVMVDPYFPRNVILVGRKGTNFLESGYVYSPYVPLQVTPTIFGPEDFTPRKGVMTRYAKKMVRPDMYGLVIVEDLLG